MLGLTWSVCERFAKVVSGKFLLPLYFTTMRKCLMNGFSKKQPAVKACSLLRVNINGGYYDQLLI